MLSEQVTKSAKQDKLAKFISVLTHNYINLGNYIAVTTIYHP